MEFKYTNKFKELLNEFYTEADTYSSLDWDLIYACIDEIKNNLFQSPNDESRIAYLKTAFLSFKAKEFEEWFKEIEEFYSIPENKKKVSKRDDSKLIVIIENSPLESAILRYIHARNCIILEVSILCSDVYKDIDFQEIMECVDIRTKSTFWVMAGKNKKQNELTAFEIALRHHYLVRGGVEVWIKPGDVGKKYKHLKCSKNIEDHYRDIDNNRCRNPKKDELINIKNTLCDFPEVQKAIMNDIDKL